jgi:hypothetical protein
LGQDKHEIIDFLMHRLGRSVLEALIRDEMPQSLLQIDRGFQKRAAVTSDDALQLSQLLLKKLV